jgi:hypothetical protein
LTGYTHSGMPHRVMKAEKRNKSVKSVPTSQSISQPAVAGILLQASTGTLKKKTIGGVSQNQTIRKDSSRYYHQLQGLHDQAANASTPGSQLKFTAAINRLSVTESIKAGDKVTDDDKRRMTPAHPMAVDLMGNRFGASSFIAAHASMQRIFQGNTKDATDVKAIVTNPHDVRGPQSLRKPVPHHGTNLKMPSLHAPEGYDNSGVYQVRKSG